MPSNYDLEHIREQAVSEIRAATTDRALFQVEKKYLGRKGTLTAVLRSLKDLPLDERRSTGKAANELSRDVNRELDTARARIAAAAKFVAFDLTEPGTQFPTGHIHPLTRVRREIESFFKSYGFTVAEGPELETDYYNFEALNIPPDHPARDIWDTFYVNSERKGRRAKGTDKSLLLRTHTSPMQVRIMEKEKPPLAVIVPGRTFRREATDARHEHTFDQVEGFYVAEEASAGELKFILHNLFRSLFGNAVKVRFRAGYFPFTEPSFELVMSCPFCGQKGCAVCGSGWLEMLGAGMIHPKVFAAAGYPKGRYRGFAFGMGLARVAMLLYNIPDIRMFYQNDLRVLRQF